MKLFKHITNGIILIIIGIMHTQFCLSADGYGNQFTNFSESNFYEISQGLEDFPINANTDFESQAAFWFFYFGLLIFPLALLVHSIEKDKKRLPLSFTISYIIVVLVGCYMIPKSGMTFFMLPHAIFMFGQNIYKTKQAHKTL